MSRVSCFFDSHCSNSLMDDTPCTRETSHHKVARKSKVNDAFWGYYTPKLIKIATHPMAYAFFHKNPSGSFLTTI